MLYQLPSYDVHYRFDFKLESMWQILDYVYYALSTMRYMHCTMHHLSYHSYSFSWRRTSLQWASYRIWSSGKKYIAHTVNGIKTNHNNTEFLRNDIKLYFYEKLCIFIIRFDFHVQYYIVCCHKQMIWLGMSRWIVSKIEFLELPGGPNPPKKTKTEKTTHKETQHTHTQHKHTKKHNTTTQPDPRPVDFRFQFSDTMFRLPDIVKAAKKIDQLVSLMTNANDKAHRALPMPTGRQARQAGGEDWQRLCVLSRTAPRDGGQAHPGKKYHTTKHNTTQQKHNTNTRKAKQRQQNTTKHIITQTTLNNKTQSKHNKRKTKPPKHNRHIRKQSKNKTERQKAWPPPRRLPFEAARSLPAP